MKKIGKIFLSVFILVIFTLNLSIAQSAQDRALYLDSSKFKPALNLIKDDPYFSIEIGIIDGKEYSLTVKNKITGEETNSIIMQSSNVDFEDYCLNVLGIDLHTMLGVKLSENQGEGNKTYTVTFDANGGAGNMEAVSNITGNYKLPSNRFTAPSGKEFRGWSKSANGEIISGNNININGNITLYAIWGDLDEAEEPVLCETKKATFNFSNPYSLNPSIDMPKAHGPSDILSLYDKTFKDGPVTISFVDYGMGVMLNAKGLYTLNLRPGASMKVSVSGDYALKEIGFWGSVGEIKEVSSSTRTWINQYDKDAKEMEFHNGVAGSNDTYIQKIVVTYTNCEFEKKPVDKTSTFNFTVPDSLNPSIILPKQKVGDILSIYDKTFKDGPVTISFVDSGEGVELNAYEFQNLYTLSLRSGASMKVSVDENYDLKSIGFWGSVDGIKELSGYPQQTWNSILYSEKPKEMEFHNDGVTYIPQIVVTYTSYNDSENQDEGKVLSIDPGKRETYMEDLKHLTNKLDGDKKSGPTTVCETKKATFNFSNPYSLNPSIDMPKAHGPSDILSLYDKTFKDGPVTISFVDYGMGVMLNAKGLYTLNLRPGASMKVSVSGDYALKEIGFWGSVGEIKEVSSSTRTWINQYDKDAKEMEFHNGVAGSNDTYIQKIVVTYLSCHDSDSGDQIIGEPKEEKCEQNPDYSWTACPEGAICSYADCGGRNGYKIESCQNDYELKDGACKCHKQLHITGELAGRYSCSMCHTEFGGGGNMCELDVKMESMCTESEDGRLYCDRQNYTAGGDRMYDIYFFLGFDAADALGIDADRLAQTKTLISRGVRLHHGYRNGEDTEYDRYDHSFYMTEKDCKDIGEKYFGSKHKGEEISLPNGYSDSACKQDCTGFDLNVCPKNKKCLVCGNKFKVVGEYHENKGWKCYKISDGMEESDECDCDSYVNKSKDGTWVTSEEPGCSVDTYMCQSETTGEKFYSGVCGGCNLGYEMKEPGKCEYIPCGADFWMEAQMNIACPEDAWKFGITCNDEYMKSAKEFVPMNGCTQAGKQFCEKHYGSDSYVGNQKWLKGFGYGDERDGCRPDYAYTYFKCTECESGYTLKNGACVADSGIGSIYYYKGDENKPIGIVFEETDDTIKIVSLQDLGGIRYDYSKGFFTPHGTYYFWEDAMAAVKQYAPNECETGSFCGKGKWRIPTREEMLKVSKNFADGGPLVQAIRGLEASCSKENSMNLLTHRYWTSTSVIQHTNVESVYGGADIDAAYVMYHPIANDDYPDTSGKKNSIQSVEEYARPVLTIYK